MPDTEESRERAVDEAFKQKLLEALGSLRPGVVPLEEEQEEVIAEYEHVAEQLAGPSFGPLPPEISGYERRDGTVRIYGTNLAAATVVKVGGIRVTRADFRFRDDEPAYIEAEVPPDGALGPLTVFTSGGLATYQAEDARERPPVAPPPKTEASKRGQVVKAAPTRRRASTKASGVAKAASTRRRASTKGTEVVKAAPTRRRASAKRSGAAKATTESRRPRADTKGGDSRGMS